MPLLELSCRAPEGVDLAFDVGEVVVEGHDMPDGFVRIVVRQERRPDFEVRAQRRALIGEDREGDFDFVLILPL